MNRKITLANLSDSVQEIADDILSGKVSYADNPGSFDKIYEQLVDAANDSSNENLIIFTMAFSSACSRGDLENVRFRAATLREIIEKRIGN